MVQTASASVAAVLVAAGAILAYEYYRQKSKGDNTYASEKVKEILGDNAGLLSSKDVELVENLINLGQAAIFQKWPPKGEKDQEKKQLLAQLHHLDDNYAGGLISYLKNSKRLLKDAQDGKNPFDGFTPSVPSGTKLDYGSQEYQDLEQQGILASKEAAFVLVAGGLGERLGYSDIKLKLPLDSVRQASYLQEYIESILALQRKHGKGTKLQLGIMTSGDTHEKTEAFLKENKYFGASKDQITLMKQEKVACLKDTEANLALNSENPFELQTKPHGHGDVHALLHSTGLAQKWKQKGVKWICLFQDTNGLVFKGLIPALGVSAKNNYDLNSLACPRKAGEAIGGIACLTHKDGRNLTINVEYNQLDPLLRATTHPDGDKNDESGYSPFPGNINQLILRMESYSEALERTKGIVAEFVNPKYTDSSKTAFKSATRLECMMQDYPLALPPKAKVGFTVINQVWAAYSPVKNNPKDALAKFEAGAPSHSATTGELDVYQLNCRTLQQLGANIESPEEKTFNGLSVEIYPRVTWSPYFALTYSDVKEKIDAKNVALTKKATLIVKGENLKIKGLELDGALIVDLKGNASLSIDHAKISNKGWNLQPNKDGPGKRPATEEEKMRGFVVCRREAKELNFASGSHIFPGKSENPKSEDTEATPAFA